MTFAFTTQNLILIGVGLHLLGGLAKAVFRTPKQQAQIDSIEGKVDAVLGEVQQVIPAVQTTVQKVAAAPPAPDLSLGLQALPPTSSSAQGGAS